MSRVFDGSDAPRLRAPKPGEANRPIRVGGRRRSRCPRRATIAGSSRRRARGGVGHSRADADGRSSAVRVFPRGSRAPRAKKGRQLKQIDPPSRSRGRRGRRSPRSRRANDARARRGRSSRRDRATADVHAAGSTRSGRGFFLSSVRSAVARTYDLRELLVHGLAVDVRLLEERGRFLERILERHRASRGSSTRARSSVARRRSAQTFLNQFASRSRPAPKNH